MITQLTTPGFSFELLATLGHASLEQANVRGSDLVGGIDQHRCGDSCAGTHR